jgi:curli biogenesis system outer membrane secretion channel CsgG
MRAKSRVYAATVRSGGLSAVAILAALMFAPAAATSQAARPDQRPTVAVMPNFDNGSVMNHADYDALGKGIADVLITELAANNSIRVVERDRIQQLMDEQNLGASGRVDKATAVQVGKLLGVHHMIFGGFIIDPKGQMRLDARAVNVETSEIEHVESVTDKADNMLAVISSMADKLNKGMKLPPMPGGVARPAVNPEATKPGRWKDLILYARAEDANDKKDRPQALALYKDFLDKTPSVVLATQRRRAEQKVRELASGS